MPYMFLRTYPMIAVFLAITLNTGLAQSNDCATATTICSNPPAMGNPSGNGGYDDFSDPDNDPGCLTAEGNTAWYYFEIAAGAPSGLELGFTIFPDGGYGEDYDWALFGPDVDCGDLGSPIRCSSASAFCQFCPETGMGMGATDFSEGPGFGDGFVATLQVSGGQGFYIAINNWYGTGNGFTLEFTGSAAPFLDCTAQPPCSVKAEASDNVTVCEGESPFEISATGDGGLPPYTYSWSGSGNGTDYLSDPTAQNPMVTLPAGVNGSITYYVTVSDGICLDIDSLQVTIHPAPTVSIDPLDPLCTDDNGSIQATGDPQNGTWGGIANSQGVIVPANYPAGIHWLTLSTVNAQGCAGTDSLAVTILDPEPITISPLPPLCVSSDPVFLEATPTGGIWSGDIGADGLVHPGQLGAGAFVANYEYVSLYGCRSTAYIIIDIFANPEPLILDPGPVCSDQSGLQLEADPSGGTWGGVANAGGSINPFQLGPGMHPVSYQFTSNEGCPGADSLLIEVVDPPFADLLQVATVCNSAGGGQTTVLNLTDLILDGDAGGFWLDLQQSGASGNPPVLDFNGVVPGSYTFQYTTFSAQGDCAEYEGTVTIIVEECECPSVALVPNTSWCNDLDSLDLNLLRLTGEPGSWTMISTPAGAQPATLTGSALLTDGRDPGNYLLQYVLSTTPPPGCPDRATTTVTLHAPPTAQLQDSFTVCNRTGTGSHPSVLDLYSLVLAGDTAGMWTIPGGAGASGSPGSLSFDGANPGLYTFLYQTASAQPPCPETVTSLLIRVADCSCPGVDLSPPPALCNDQGLLDLQSLVQSSEPGQWSVQGTPGGSNPAAINGTSFEGTGRDPGVYLLRFTLLQSPPLGCPDHAETTLTLQAPPFATLQPLLTVCNSPQPTDPTVLDLSEFIVDGDQGGLWTDLSGSGAGGTIPLLDFEGVSPGLYPFTYMTQSAQPPCNEQEYTVQVLVKNCLCPDLDLLPNASLCNSQVGLDLNTLILQAAPGSWTFPSGPGAPGPVLNGNLLEVQGATQGIYTLVYALTDPPPAGCPAVAEVQIELHDQPDPGAQTQALHICHGESRTLHLIDALDGSDPDGQWSFFGGPILPGGAFLAGSGLLHTGNLTPGDYAFRYSLSAMTPCQDTSTLVTVSILPLPFADAGPDQVLTCQQPGVQLGGTGLPDPSLNYLWNGPSVSMPHDPRPYTFQPGEYVLTVLDPSSGCEASDTVVVNTAGTLIADLDLDTDPTSCPEAENGALRVSGISGGTPPYRYRLNGSPWQADLHFTGLQAGTHLLEVEDALGCVTDTLVLLPAGNGFQVDLGEDLEVLPGTNVDMIPVLNPPGTTVAEWLWSPQPPGCAECERFSYPAEEDLTWSLTAIDEHGCRASDQRSIRVLPRRQVYIPNAFSPNGDGINDRFIIYWGEGVTLVRSLRIFDRWGNALFEQNDLDPDDPNAGWDGSFRHRPVERDVYVYAIEVQFADGSIRLFKGDVLVSATLPR